SRASAGVCQTYSSTSVGRFRRMPMPISTIAASAATPRPPANPIEVTDDPEPDEPGPDGSTFAIGPLIGWPAAADIALTAVTPAAVRVSGSFVPGGRSGLTARESGPPGATPNPWGITTASAPR